MKRTTLIIILLLMNSYFCGKNIKDSSADNIKNVSIEKSVIEEYRMPTNPISKAEITKILKNLKNLKLSSVKPNEIGVIETNFGTIKFKFFSKDAPVHCAVFKMLAQNRFYNGVTFHRVVKGFIIQGGDILTRDNNPYNDGTGNPGIRIPEEFNTKSHKRGIISAARMENNRNSASGQFFICHGDAPFLDQRYTVFGDVLEGMHVVDRIAQVPVNPDDNNRPIEDLIMQRVRVIKE